MRVRLVKWIVSLGLLAALALMAMACGSDEGSGGGRGLV